MKRRLSTIAGLAFLIASSFGPAPDASAQDSTIVTVPCDGCGPSSTKVPGAWAAWAYPEHACRTTGESDFYVTFGLGRNAPGAANFYVRFTNGPLPDGILGTLEPGHQMTKFVTTVEPGEPVDIQVYAYAAQGGAPVKFGDGTYAKNFQLECDCPQPPTTTTPPTTPPPTTTPPTTPSTVPPTTVTTSPPATTTPPTSTPVTTPGTPTVPPPSSVPGTPPSITELPSVGVPEWLRWAALVGIGLLAVGAGAVRWGREGR